MRRALGSRINLDAFDTDIAYDFYECVKDIINSDLVKKLEYYTQHMDVNRLEHSLGVAYYSFLFCRKLKLDCRSAARGGLLHDLFFYDRAKVSLPDSHCAFHPRHALENAALICELSELERDIIVNHMWPMAGRPHSYESLIVSMIDKFCAASEFFSYVFRGIARSGRHIAAAARAFT